MNRSEQLTAGEGLLLETSSILSVIAGYKTRNDLYEHLSEEVLRMNRSEQIMTREGLLFWRPLRFCVIAV